MPRGLLITLEGLDGSGKTTQIERLAVWLKKRKPAAVRTEPPCARAPSLRLSSGERVGDRETQSTGLLGAPVLVRRGGETWDFSRGVIVTRQPGGTAIGD